MRFVSIIIALTLSAIIQAQISQVRKVSSFNAVSVFGSIDIELMPGYSDSIKIEGEQQVLDKVSVTNDGKTLKLSLRKGIFDKRRKVKIIISHSSFTSIKLSGGAEISSAHIINADTLFLASRNGSNINVKIEATKIIADLGEGSTIAIEGKCQNLIIDSSSGGLFSGYEMVANEATVKSNAGSILKVYALQNLDAYASTGGQVSYRGSPTKLLERTALGGIIEKLVEN